jgi:hypothetical protein
MILGTWNLLNETKGAMGNMSMDDMNNMTGVSGKITFTVHTTFMHTINGKTWHILGRWEYSIYYDCTHGYCVNMQVMTSTPNRIEATDGSFVHFSQIQ